MKEVNKEKVQKVVEGIIGPLLVVVAMLIVVWTLPQRDKNDKGGVGLP